MSVGSVVEAVGPSEEEGVYEFTGLGCVGVEAVEEAEYGVGYGCQE